MNSGQTYQVEIIAFYIDGIPSDPVSLSILFVEGDDMLNLETKLLGNYPNPFNPATTISFTLNPEDADNVSHVIFDNKGRKVKDLSSSLCHPEFIEGRGDNQVNVVWHGIDDSNKPVASGIYFYRLKAGDKVFSRKMIMIK